MIESKRGAAWVWILLVVVLIVIAVAAYVMLSGDSGPATQAASSAAGTASAPVPPALP